MANKTIAELTEAAALDGAELMHLVQGGNSRRILVARLLDELMDLTGYPSLLDGAVRGDIDQTGKGNGWREQVWANARQGLVKLLSGTVTPGATSLDVPLQSGFSSYEVKLNLTGATANADLYGRISSDGGATFDAGSSDYAYDLMVPHSGGGSYYTRQNEAEAFMFVAVGSQVNNIKATVSLTHPEDPTVRQSLSVIGQGSADSGGRLQISIGGGKRNALKSVNALRFYFSSGAIASGTYEVYGYV